MLDWLTKIRIFANLACVSQKLSTNAINIQFKKKINYLKVFLENDVPLIRVIIFIFINLFEKYYNCHN